jgi:hypothetical protein
MKVIEFFPLIAVIVGISVGVFVYTKDSIPATFKKARDVLAIIGTGTILYYFILYYFMK